MLARLGGLSHVSLVAGLLLTTLFFCLNVFVYVSLSNTQSQLTLIQNNLENSRVMMMQHVSSHTPAPRRPRDRERERERMRTMKQRPTDIPTSVPTLLPLSLHQLENADVSDLALLQQHSESLSARIAEAMNQQDYELSNTLRQQYKRIDQHIHRIQNQQKQIEQSALARREANELAKYERHEQDSRERRARRAQRQRKLPDMDIEQLMTQEDMEQLQQIQAEMSMDLVADDEAEESMSVSERVRRRADLARRRAEREQRAVQLERNMELKISRLRQKQQQQEDSSDSDSELSDEDMSVAGGPMSDLDSLDNDEDPTPPPHHNHVIRGHPVHSNHINVPGPGPPRAHGHNPYQQHRRLGVATHGSQVDSPEASHTHPHHHAHPHPPHPQPHTRRHRHSDNTGGEGVGDVESGAVERFNLIAAEQAEQAAAAENARARHEALQQARQRRQQQMEAERAQMLADLEAEQEQEQQQQQQQQQQQPAWFDPQQQNQQQQQQQQPEQQQDQARPESPAEPLSDSTETPSQVQPENAQAGGGGGAEAGSERVDRGSRDGVSESEVSVSNPTNPDTRDGESVNVPSNTTPAVRAVAMDRTEIAGSPDSPAAVASETVAATSTDAPVVDEPHQMESLSTPSPSSSLSDLVVVYDFGSCGCTGWAMEAINIVLGLYNTVPQLGIIAGDGCWCPGLDEQVLAVLQYLQNRPVHTWNIDVFISHKPPQRYPRFPYRGLRLINTRPRYVIGRSMTEATPLSPLWVSRVSDVDEIWVPSQHSRQAFIDAGIPNSKLQIIHEPIDPNLYDINVQPLPLEHLAGYNFLSVFKMEPRKGWGLLIRAFFEEFSASDDVALFVQTYLYGDSNPYDRDKIMRIIREYVSTLNFGSRDPATLPWSRVHVLTGQRNTADMPRLYKTMQAFVLPTHGEGWGLPLMEAMAMGLPVIATNYSGHLEFMHPSNSLLIPVERMEPAQGPDFIPGQTWATPNIHILKQLMRQLFDNRSLGTSLGSVARESVLSNFNIETVAAQVIQQLTRVKHILDTGGPIHTGGGPTSTSAPLTTQTPIQPQPQQPQDAAQSPSVDPLASRAQQILAHRPHDSADDIQQQQATATPAGSGSSPDLWLQAGQAEPAEEAEAAQDQDQGRTLRHRVSSARDAVHSNSRHGQGEGAARGNNHRPRGRYHAQRANQNRRP